MTQVEEAQIVLDWPKYLAMVHYVCESFADDPARLGKVKLQKILWHSDKEAYLELGRPISGAGYVRMPQGPACPKLDKALDELQRQGKLCVREVEFRGRKQFLFLSLEKAEPNTFSGAEVDIIQRWVSNIRPKTASRVSEESHDLTWEVYGNGETIRYESAFVPVSGDPDPEGLDAALAAFRAAADGVPN